MRLLVFFIFYSICLFGADPGKGTYSPYSFYGLGEKGFKGSVEVMSMGGISTNFYSPVITNISNPASLSKLALTNFSAGLSVNQSNYYQGNISSSNNSTQINNINIGVPLLDNTLGISFGLHPYSYVGYEMSKITVKDTNNLRVDNLTGSGGTNNIYFGAGYSLNDYIRVGFSINYIFGNIEKRSMYTETIFNFSSYYSNFIFLKGIRPDIGLQGDYDIAKDLNINYGILYKMGVNLSGKITNESYSRNTNTGVIIDTNSLFLEKKDGSISIPHEFSFAVGLGNMQFWNFSVQYDIVYNTNSSDNTQNISYNMGNKIIVGGYYNHSNNIYDPIYSRIIYRAGFFYEQKDFSIFGNKLTDVGFSLGMSIPFGNRASFLNLGFVKGVFGRNFENMIKEDYWKIYVSINFNDRWFIKYKYD